MPAAELVSVQHAPVVVGGANITPTRDDWTQIAISGGAGGLGGAGHRVDPASGGVGPPAARPPIAQRAARPGR
ncbi:hypothetical protein LV779_09570 [Streptomyces thinghirensis]|nr:hypothetical protein [Streptomyces thinghirensis]